MSSKFVLILLTWLAASILSFLLKYWAAGHPSNYIVNDFVVIALLLGPSLLIGLYLFVMALKKFNSET